jgi:hypothetical protein
MHERISVHTLSDFPGLGYKNASISRTLFAISTMWECFQTALFKMSFNVGSNTEWVIIYIQFRKYSMSH